MNSQTYLEQLKKTLRASDNYQNMVDSSEINKYDLYQKASEVQKPITEKLEKMVEEVQKIQTPQKSSSISITQGSSKSTLGAVPIDRAFKNKQSYGLIKTGKLKDAIVDGNKIYFDEWIFNSDADSNHGSFILFKQDNKDQIWDIIADRDPVILTEGLEEILFRGAENISKLSQNDILDWIELISRAGLGSFYKKTDIFKRISESSIGEGLDVHFIPSDPDELKEHLILELSAAKGGHINTFNRANAIMKELLRQKKINGKDYRDILKSVYHI